MFSLLIGVGALFLAVIACAVIGPRAPRAEDDDRTRADYGREHPIDGALRQRITRHWKWRAPIASRTASRNAAIPRPAPLAPL
jgi:hypothetical protein